jgi:hypothetical protein
MDPRFLQQGPRRRHRIPNGGAFQPDEAAIASTNNQDAGGFIPFERASAWLNQRNIPPQLRQTPYTAFLKKTDPRATLLIPANPKRISWIIGNQNADDALFFSYDYPVTLNGGLVGLPVGMGGLFMETNGSVSVNDIYVFTLSEVPVGVLGYEGVLAIESLQHNQTSRQGL